MKRPTSWLEVDWLNDNDDTRLSDEYRKRINSILDTCHHATVTLSQVMSNVTNAISLMDIELMLNDANDDDDDAWFTPDDWPKGGIQ
jgi:hypothetical protein